MNGFLWFALKANQKGVPEKDERPIALPVSETPAARTGPSPQANRHSQKATCGIQGV